MLRWSILVLAAVLLDGCGSPAPAPMPDASSRPEYCYPSQKFPTCADGSFRDWDEYCVTQTPGVLSCSPMGSGACLPFCDSGGKCPAGSTCGEIALYQCTHYCSKVAKVCFPGSDVKITGCKPHPGLPDAGESVGDTGVLIPVDAGP